MQTSAPSRLLPGLLAGIAGLLGAGSASSAGFQLFEQGVSGLGTAFAATAAAEDASTIFWNPAGLSYLSGRNVALGAHLINSKSRFTNQGSRLGFAPIPLSGGDGGDAGGLAVVPNFFYSQPLGSRLAFGIGVTSPFGLKTEYDDGWVGRYHALTSDLRTINVNPSLAWRASDSVSLGAGINVLYAKAELSNAIDFGTVCLGQLGPAACAGLGLAPQANDGRVEIEGDDTASYGFNLGAMFQVAAGTRIGVAYRSRIKVKIEGDAAFSGVPAPFAAAFANQPATAEVTLPDMLSVGVRSEVGPSLTLVADLTWTHWSLFKELRVRFGAGFPDAVTPQNWDDSWKLALGAIYRLDPRWTLRGGVAFDQSPVPDEFRTPRIPDQDRSWLAVGANVKVSDAGSIDFGYTHVFIKDASLNAASASAGNLVGRYERSKVNIFSAQYNHRF